MKESPAPVPGAVATHKINRLAAPAAIAACVTLFYWAPMTLGARHASPLEIGHWKGRTGAGDKG